VKKLKYPKLSSRLLIKRALAEDAPHGDITSRATIPPRAKCKARAIAKQEMILAGIDLFADVFHTLDANIKIKRLFKDGELVPKGAIIATMQGKTRAILTAERVALNYMQRLSGIATLTKKFVDAVAETKTVILDTRKTTPGLRDLEKYAVLCGGGQNHRRNLSEMALIKENHVTSAGGIAEAVSRIRKKYKTKIEVETRNLKEVAEALRAGADRIMLDNMTPAQAKKAIAQIAGLAETEASGNMSLKTVRKYAETGVDFISIGALTHSPPSADISLLLDAK